MPEIQNTCTQIRVLQEFSEILSLNPQLKCLSLPGDERAYTKEILQYIIEKEPIQLESLSFDNIPRYLNQVFHFRNVKKYKNELAHFSWWTNFTNNPLAMFSFKCLQEIHRSNFSRVYLRIPRKKSIDNKT